jgi:hypothetical protein
MKRDGGKTGALVLGFAEIVSDDFPIRQAADSVPFVLDTATTKSYERA